MKEEFTFEVQPYQEEFSNLTGEQVTYLKEKLIVRKASATGKSESIFARGTVFVDQVKREKLQRAISTLIQEDIERMREQGRLGSSSLPSLSSFSNQIIS